MSYLYVAGLVIIALAIFLPQIVRALKKRSKHRNNQPCSTPNYHASHHPPKRSIEVCSGRDIAATLLVPQGANSENISREQRLVLAPLRNDDAITKLRRNLRLKVMGDDQVINRMIAFERQHQPNASLEDLMRAAIYRWEHDNG